MEIAKMSGILKHFSLFFLRLWAGLTQPVWGWAIN